MIDLRLSDDQRQIVEAAAAVLQAHSPVARLRPGAAPDDVHARLAEWGWFGVGLTEDDGGFGLGVAEEALLYFEAGRYLLSPSVLATTLAARLAGPELRAGLLDGSRRAAAVAVTEDGADYCIDRGGAEVLLVTLSPEGVGLFPVDAFAGEAVDGLDEALTLEKGALDQYRVLASEPGERGVLLAAAMLAGSARAACDLAVEYAKIREQFGQPIGAFQAVKHRCADMGVAAFAAEAQVKIAATAAAEGVAHTAFEIAAAARTALVAARENGAAAIQVHGGMGFTAQCDAHLFVKRSHVLGRLIGGQARQEAWLMECPAPDNG